MNIRFALMSYCLLALLFSAWGQTDPTNQIVNTWEFQYRKAELGDVTHPYENGFVWDTKNDIGVVFGGHLGTYYQQLESDLVEIMNTNMTYTFSFTGHQFSKTRPMDRPPKRCGPKIAYDDGWGHAITVGGGFHNYVNGYSETNSNLVGFQREDPYVMNPSKTHPPWAFNGATQQWYAMRPLNYSAPQGLAPYGGYGSTYAFATEYGLMLLMPTQYNRVYSYSPYSNQWTTLPKLATDPAFPPETDQYFCVAYDLKHRKLVVTNGNTSGTVVTFAYDVGTHSWTKVNSATQPTRYNNPDSMAWYMAWNAMTYDRKNGVCVYLNWDGSKTWALDLDSAKWTDMQPTGAPSSCGSMGEGMAYDPKRNVSLVYANKYDEVWTYKYGNGIANRPDPPTDPAGVTDASGITVSWTAPTAGAAPVKYYIYRAAWEDNKGTGTGLIPGPYVKRDSTFQTTWQDTQTDSLILAGIFNSYSITAVSAQGIESDMSPPVYTRLRVPFGLTTTLYSRNAAILRWKPKKEPDVVGYNIYRAKKAYPNPKGLMSGKINAALITGLTYYIDSTLSLCDTAATCADSTMALYVVTAVNRLGKESGFSPYALTGPDWVTNMWVDTVNKKVCWSPPRNGNINYYRIYEGRVGTWDGGSSKPSPVAIVTDTFWSYAGRTVTAYKVRAYSKAMTQPGYISDVMEVQTKDQDDFGMLRVDFQTQPPVVDTFYNDIPSLQIAIEDGILNSDTAELDLSVIPNPFNPAARISVKRRDVMAPVDLKIYTVTGSLVKDFAGDSRLAGQGKTLSISWNAGHLPSGMYMARVKSGKNVLYKKLVLLK